MDNKKFQGKYRVESCRLKGWDYSNDGYYFVTVCIKNRIHYFGEVENEKMHLSEFGKIAVDEWLKAPMIRQNVKLDEFIVMPNHIHGIIIIGNKDINEIAMPEWDLIKSVETPRWGVLESSLAVSGSQDETPQRGVLESSLAVSGSQDETPQRGVSTTGGYHSEWKPNSLGSIINQFKSACTKRIRKSDKNFTWQERFYDHIIRDEIALYNIQQYIIDNLSEWERDRNNPEGLFM